MQIGLSHLSEKRAWRIVSEDSGVRRSFLLIVRTLQIVTAAHAASTEGCTGFPAYSQVYLRNYNGRSYSITIKTLCSSTVSSLSIVTAAVYRGFDQELRLAADPIN
jgi:hypothetical protein